MLSTLERTVWGRERSGTESAPARFGGGELGRDGLELSLLFEEEGTAWTGRTVRKVEAVNRISRNPFRTFEASRECFPGTQRLTLSSVVREDLTLHLDMLIKDERTFHTPKS